MKKKFLKALVIVGCAILLVIATITGTVAYLTSVKEVKNTFTVGNVTITLDEAPVDENGEKTTGERHSNGNKYHLIPGGVYDKDPIIHVAANSEECYLFVKVVNPIALVEETGKTIAEQLADNNWDEYDASNGIYVYHSTVAKSDTQTNIKLFDEVVISENATNEQLEALAGDIVITAYAVQAAGMADVDAAWNAVENITPTNP